MTKVKKVKMKTKKGLAKRVKLNAAGKAKRGHAFRSHLAQNKSTKQKRQSRSGDFVSSSDMKRIKDLI